MATRKDTLAHILGRLGHAERFTTQAMFGEYALYADGKVVALVCDDHLYVKAVPASKVLSEVCELAPPFPGAKPYYLINEEDLTRLHTLPELLLRMAETLPLPKKKKNKKV